MKNVSRVVICGGGIVGLSCAYYLAREGYGVTVIESRSEGADSCVHGSAGFISPSHVIPLSAPGMIVQGLKWMANPRSPFYIKPRLDWELLQWTWLFSRACTRAHTQRAAPVLRDLCNLGKELFVELSAKSGDAFELKAKGLLNLCKTQAGLDHEAHGLARLANELGVEARVFDARQTAQLEPGTRLDVAGSVYFPGDAHLTPRKLVPALLDLAKKSGVAFRWETSISGWRQDGGKIIAARTTTGEIEGDEFVLCGGAWSAGILEGLDARLPMQAGKGYNLTQPSPRLHITTPMILTERRIAISPMGDQLRFGGTMELSGINHVIRRERVRQIIESVPHYLPEVTERDFEGIEPWCGLRPLSADGLPYIGRFAKHPNLIAACGHAMLGLTMAPSTGLIVTEIISGRKPSVPLELLNPDRYR